MVNTLIKWSSYIVEGASTTSLTSDSSVQTVSSVGCWYYGFAEDQQQKQACSCISRLLHQMADGVCDFRPEDPQNCWCLGVRNCSCYRWTWEFAIWIRDQLAITFHDRSMQQHITLRLVKRSNRRLKSMLCKHASRYDDEWDQHLYQVLWANRSTPNKSNGEKPFFLLYSWDQWKLSC